MSYRGIPQYSQGFSHIPPQAVMGGNQPLKNKRNLIGRQPGNNVGIQPVPISNPYGELAPQSQAMNPQHGHGLQVAQAPQQQTVQYFVQPPPQPIQQPQQFNRIPNNPPAYPQFVQSGYSYPMYQTKNIVSGMQPNSSDPSILGQHQIPPSLAQQSHLQQIPPQPPLQHMQITQHAQHPQESMIYQSPYSKVPMDYIQPQQPKMGMRQQYESKPMIQPPPHHPPQQQSQLINYQQSAIQQQQQIQQPQQRIESTMSSPISSFAPDYNSPPAGPFDIVGRGNLPSFNFVYSQDL